MKKLITIFASFAMFLVVLSGCGQTSDSSRNSFILAIEADPGNVVNPVTTGSRYGLSELNAVFSQLYVFDGSEDVEFRLADSMELSDDMTTYTFKLKEGVKFHDGEEFTAADVVFTFNTLLNDPTSEYSTSLNFGGQPVVVSAVDDYTVEFKLEEFKPNALEVFGAVFIMPEHIYKDVTDYTTAQIDPVGTGPYMFDKYNEGDSIVMKKNADYFGGEPSIDQVIFKVISDSNTANLALQNGEVDAVSIQPSDVEKFDKEEININAYSEGRIGYMSFNFDSQTGNEGVDNADFRKAVLYAIDKEGIIQASYISEEYSLNPVSFLSSTSTYVSDDVNPYGVDVEMSKEYLAASGVTSPKLSLAYPGNNPIYNKQATLIQDNLKTVGIDLTLVSMDSTAMGKNLENHDGNFDLYLSGYIMTIDPDGYAPLFITDSPINYSGYSNPKIDQLFNDGVSESDSTMREATYLELQQTFADDAFFLPLTENKRVLAISSRITGVEEAGLVPIYNFSDWSKLSIK